jgi:hypothetical protein
VYPAAAVAAFVMIAVPLGVAVAVWAVVTMFRVLFPERPLPVLLDPARERRDRTARGEAVPVGFREIYEEMPVHAGRLALPYRLDRERVHSGLPGHVPEPWRDDLYLRRN